MFFFQKVIGTPAELVAHSNQIKSETNLEHIFAFDDTLPWGLKANY